MSSDIRRRETKTVPYNVALERITDPTVRAVFRHVYDHLPKDLITFEDLEGLGGTVSEALVNPQYYDRGDPAVADWEESDLTCDGNWHTLDLTTVNSAIAQATEVKLRVVFGGGSGWLYVRENGNSNEVNMDGQIYESGDPQSAFTLLVTPDENGYIAYKASAAGTIDLSVAGWWGGYGSSGTGASSEIALNSAHRLGDGSDHADVATHDGYLNQAVKTTSSPTFGGLTLTPLSGVLKATAGVVGGSADSDDVDEGATNLYFTEARANAASDVVAAKAHITADGSSHSHIASNHPHQAVDTADAPTFGGVTSNGQLVVQTATNLPLSSYGEAAGGNVGYYYMNNAAVAAANSVGYSLRVRSSTAMRTAATLVASLPTTTDASRTGRLEMQVPDNGGIASRLAVEGKIVRAENGGLVTVLPSNGAPSTTPEAGSLYFDTGTSKLMVYTGASWVAVH